MVSRRRASALVTVLFTDIVGSTEIAAELGDRRWRELLTRHHRIIRRQLRRFGGREVDSAGDGFLAAFSEPAEALRSAAAIVEAVQELGIDVRTGVHVGQAEVMGRRVGGIAIHVGARIASQAGPAEILVSRTLTELVPGAGFRFEDRGTHQLKGVPGEHKLFVLGAIDGRRPVQPPQPDEARRRRDSIVAPPLHRRPRVLVAAVAAALVIAGAVIVLPGEDPSPRSGTPLPPNSLVRIDPDTNRVDLRLKGIDLIPARGSLEMDIAAGEGGVWVTTTTTLNFVDPENGEVSRLATSGWAHRVGLGHDAVWVSEFSQASWIGRIEPASRAEVAIIDVGLGAVRSVLGTTVDSVWVGSGSSSILVRIDPVDNRVSGRFDVDQRVDEMATAGRDLWIADRLTGTLSWFDTRQERVVDARVLDSPLDSMAAGDRGDIWAVNTEGGTVARIQYPGSHLSQPIRVGTHPVDVAVSTDAVWVADGEDGTVTRIDRQLVRVDRVIHLGRPVGAVTVEKGTGDVWALVL